MSKKRSRPSEVDESRAECPFTVKQRAPVARRLEKKTKRDGAEDTHKDEWHSQSCPFIAKAFDDNNESLDIEYSIDPPRWTEMTKYNSFVCEYSFTEEREPGQMLTTRCSGQG